MFYLVILQLFFLIWNMDYDEIKHYAVNQLIKNRGIYTLKTLKALQTQFAQKLESDEINPTLTINFLHQLKSLLYSYEVLTIEISQQFQFLEIKQFGEAIAKMYYQIIEIVRFLVRKNNLVHAGKPNNNKIEIQPLKIKPDEQYARDQFSLKKLKFEQIEKDKFYIYDAQNTINQMSEPDQYLDNLEKELIERKQAVLNTNYSKTQGILKETLNVLANNSKYTNNYIKLTQQKIKNERALFQTNPENFYTMFNVSKQEAVLKTKFTFKNLKDRIQIQEIQRKQTMKRTLVDKQTQIDTLTQSGEVGLKKDIQKKKLIDRLTRQTKENSKNKDKVIQLQLNIHKKDIQITNLTAQVKKLQANILSLNYELLKKKQQFEIRIQTEKQIDQTNNHIQTQIGSQKQNRPPKYFRMRRMGILQMVDERNIKGQNTLNKIMEILVLPEIKSIQKYDQTTDTSELLAETYKQIKQKLYDSDGSTPTYLNVKKVDQLTFNKKCNDYSIQIDMELELNIENGEQIKKHKKRTQKKIKQLKRIFQDISKQVIKESPTIQIKDMVQNYIKSYNSSNSTPRLQPKNLLKPNEKITQKLLPQMKSGFLNNGGNKLLSITSHQKFTFQSKLPLEQKLLPKQNSYKEVVNFEMEDLQIFGGQELAKNVQTIRLNELKNLKQTHIRKQHPINTKQINLNNKLTVKENQRLQNRYQKIIKNFYKYTLELKGFNLKRYTKLRNFLRYPYNSMMLQKQEVFQNDYDEPDLSYDQIRRTIKRIIKIHRNCSISQQIFCSHLLNFWNKIGFFNR